MINHKGQAVYRSSPPRTFAGMLEQIKISKMSLDKATQEIATLEDRVPTLEQQVAEGADEARRLIRANRHRPGEEWKWVDSEVWGHDWLQERSQPGFRIKCVEGNVVISQDPIPGQTTRREIEIPMSVLDVVMRYGKNCDTLASYLARPGREFKI